MTILVVRTDKLGDFITALPTLYVLKRHDPSHRIVACVAPLNRELAEHCDFIDAVIVDEGGALLPLVRALRRERIDASITLFSNTRVALAQFLARIPQRIAPATKIAQIFYSQRIRQRRSRVTMAEYEYNLALADVLFAGIDRRFPQPLLTFPPETPTELTGLTRPIVAFHPGFGGSSDANWSRQAYLELASTAKQHGAVEVLFTFGPDESGLHDWFAERITGVHFYTSRSGLVPFAQLLSRFALFVSTSTGPYHLAAAVGTPTMTFFGDSKFASVARWKAISPEALQHPYMLSTDLQQRQEQFSRVKTDLTLLIDELCSV